MESTLTQPRNTVESAIRYLAARCDGAVDEDGQGFNGTDTGLGRYLATLPDGQWSDEMRRAAYEMVAKYRRQLEGGDIDYDRIPEPPKVEGARQAAQSQRSHLNRQARDNGGKVPTALREVKLEGGQLKVTFPYDAELVAAVRNVPGRRWDGSANRIPLASAAALAAAIEGHDFALSGGAQEILESADPAEVKPVRRIELIEGKRGSAKFAVYTPKDDGVLRLVRSVEGRRWDADELRWTLPTKAHAIDAVNALIADHGCEIYGDEVQAKLDELRAEQRKAKAREAMLLKQSGVAEGEIDIDSLGGAPYAFQAAGVQYALAADGRTFIGDEMGLGKTVTALAAIEAKQAYPALIVQRGDLKLSWRDHIQGPTPGAPNGWLPGKKVAVLYGQKPDPEAAKGADIILANYEILSHWAGMAGIERGKHKCDDAPGLLCEIGLKALVVDESQRIKEEKAQRTRACLMISKTLPDDALILNLTGTSVRNRPRELLAQLKVLQRLDDFGGAWKFLQRYCGAYQTRHGWDFSGATNLDELHTKLRSTCYIRRLKKDVLADLPDKLPPALVPVELTNKREYQDAEADVIEWLRTSAEADDEIKAEIADLPEAEREARLTAYREQKARSAGKAEQLNRMNVLRRIAAMGKISAAKDWVEGFLENESKLIVFAYHRDVQHALIETFPGCAKLIAGQGPEEQQEQKRRFQEDEDCHLIVCSLEVAREGHTLTAASNVLFVELMWSPADIDQATDRAHRIGQERVVRPWWLIAEGETIDTDMTAILDEKREVMDKIQDGEAREKVGRESVASKVAKRLQGRA